MVLRGLAESSLEESSENPYVPQTSELNGDLQRRGGGDTQGAAEKYSLRADLCEKAKGPLIGFHYDTSEQEHG